MNFDNYEWRLKQYEKIANEKIMKYYRADSEGYYDIEQIMRDIKNGVEEIEIDFSEYLDTINKNLKEQEKYYKK